MCHSSSIVTFILGSGLLLVLSLLVGRLTGMAKLARFGSAIASATVVATVAIRMVSEDGYCQALCLTVYYGVISWWTAFLAGCWC